MRNLVLLIMLSFLCAGCIIFPIPEHTSPGARAPIGKESLEFLAVGSTTREQVLLNLGDPDHVQDNERVFTYAWWTKGGVGVIAAHGYSAAGGRILDYKAYQLIIEFDESGIVSSYELEIW